ncbi:MAG: 3-deoxy-D-manno-octulosonic acid transferase [Gammaproteobacteria bacterium]|nr:3-deoxy-D-manno-octulosonic acid transferase [Gammaproteobacteria bacterium]
MILSYQLLLFILLPVFAGITIRHYLNNKDALYLWQRCALKLPGISKPVWFHCASVGEINAAIPLITLQQKKYPQQKILVTTNTVTAARICQQRLSFVSHCYLPLDYRLSIRHFLKKIQPQKLIVLETEIWPNLFQLCHQQKIAVAIVNGRLSEKTLNTNSWIRKIYKTSLSYISKIYCRSEADAEGFEFLQAAAEKIECIGNLKFSLVTQSTESEANLIGRQYVLAASTREDEELEIVTIWQQSEHRDLLLVIAPRHPQRKDDIINTLKPLAAEITVRSQHQQISEHTDIYLADTIGEMGALFQHAEFVIMGGSFVKKGGHNILEPAAYSKAIIYGPHMENFAAENILFLENEAAIQANDRDSAVRSISQLISDQPLRQRLGKNAKQLMIKNRNIAELYLQKISRL